MSFDGILLIDKNKDWSSFDVVAKIRGILSSQYYKEYGVKKKIKVGHTGTLDPLASGLMIIVVGSYCKRAQEFSKVDKIYEVQMKLGETSTTGDEEGIKTKVDSKKYDHSKVVEALNSFLGESLQVPPAFSAIKIDGKRAYKLAREGKLVEIEPRKVEIYSIKLNSYHYPYIEFTVHVSSGTYIRSLVEDIGKILSTGAYMSQLRRTQVGKFQLASSIKIEDVNSLKLLKV
jgi:tRNA pseudouridine55 synthase